MADQSEYERGWQDAITHLSPPGSAERADLVCQVAGYHRTFAGVLEALVRDHARIDRALARLPEVQASIEEFEEWSVWETKPGGINVHTPATHDPDHLRCDCPGGVAMHETQEWANELAEEIRAAGGTAEVRRRLVTWSTGQWLAVPDAG